MASLAASVGSRLWLDEGTVNVLHSGVESAQSRPTPRLRSTAEDTR